MYDEDSIDEVYHGEGREDLVDNDEISAEEEAFMNGYDEDHVSSDESKKADTIYEAAFDSKRRSRRSKSKADAFDDVDLEDDTLMR